MITKITGEQPFQVLTNNFSISPSNEGYTLQISADGVNFSNLFQVGANVTRLVTGVAANSYYRLLGNNSRVSINWLKVCVTEGGGSGSGTELTPVTSFPVGAEAGTVVALVSGDTVGIYQYDGENWNAAGGEVDLSAYWTSAQTQSAITAVEDHLFDVEEVTASALTELHEGLLEVSARTTPDMSLYTPTSGFSTINGSAITNGGNIVIQGGEGGNSNILLAITTDEEYAAISGSVKTGDLIQVYNVDINDDGEPEGGLFVATVQEIEDRGVITRTIEWERRDSSESVLWSEKYYPWMVDNDVYPIELGGNAFLIAAGSGEEYNGIGFDGDGKPVITHIVPQYEEGEITGMTRTDRDILGELDIIDEVVSSALVDLKDKIDEISASTPSINLSAYTPTTGFSTINGSAITEGGNIVIEGGADMSGYWNSAQTKTYVDSGITVVQDRINVMDEVISDALNDLNGELATKVSSTYVSTIWKGTQAEYNAISVKDPYTFYIIIDNN